MGRRKHFYLQLDTETCGDLENPYVYDLGMAVVDRQGNVYETYNFVIYDVYVGMKELMQQNGLRWVLYVFLQVLT